MKQEILGVIIAAVLAGWILGAMFGAYIVWALK